MVICIDLKSFYASVECVLRGLDPFKVNLVVADKDRGPGSIVLAASPHIKKYGVKSRCRIYQLPEKLDIIYARPRMKKYIEYASKIYDVYLKYVCSEDIHVYSIDEVFLDLTPYLKYYNMSAYELSKKILDDIYKTTKLPAVCGIGENMFLAKVALDILAKQQPDGIAYLDIEGLKEKIWPHKPITDIWGIGRGIAKRLEKFKIFTLGDIARFPLKKLEKEFGIVGRELLEHAYGIERTTVQEARVYLPDSKSFGHGQVFFEDYNYKDLYTVLLETVDEVTCELIAKKLNCGLIALGVGYSKDIGGGFYRQMKLPVKTNSRKVLVEAFSKLYYDNIQNLPIRRLDVRVGKLSNEDYVQLDLFSTSEQIKKEHDLYQALGNIRDKYGKNAVYLAVSDTEKGTMLKRHKLIGGHHAE
jgi:DNA polymerase V